MNTPEKMFQLLRRALPLALAALVTLAATAGIYFWTSASGDSHTHDTAAAGMQEQRDVYYCPMHPQYTSDRPGNCPICSMQLVKREPRKAAPPKPAPAQPAPHEHGQATPPSAPAPAQPAPHAHSGAAPAAATPPTEGPEIFISPARQQRIGMRTAVAEMRPLAREIRTVGRIAYDDRSVAHVHTKFSGYIEHVFVDFEGRQVKRGEPLFTIYSPELVATQEEYLVALRAQKQLADSPYPEVARGAESLVRAARERMRLWDVSEEDIAALERDAKVKREITIHSPVSGIVTHRAAYHHGRFVNPEMDLYTIVDLSTVWVLAEIYETDFPYVRTGQMAEVELTHTGGARTLRGRINFIYPYLNPQTRTAQARLEFPNPNLTLKPETFVDVRIRVPLGARLAVPEDAVLDTGTEQYVFVDLGDGHFEPRRVVVGGAAEGFAAIASGLRRGERVVTSANFLIDSESRLKGAFAGMGAPPAPAGHAGHAPVSPATSRPGTPKAPEKRP